jgi:hypothetical protein
MKLQAGTSSTTYTMIRKQRQSICIIIKSFKRDRKRIIGGGRLGRSKIRKRENCFIKHHIPNNVEMIRQNMRTSIPLMNRTIADKDKFFRAELKFVIIVGTKIGPTGTTEDLKKGVIWFSPSNRSRGVSMLMT